MSYVKGYLYNKSKTFGLMLNKFYRVRPQTNEMEVAIFRIVMFQLTSLVFVLLRDGGMGLDIGMAGLAKSV